MDKLTVSKFDGHDFAVWKFQMMGFLEYHGLLEIVEGTTKRPTSGDTSAWDKLDKKARFYIGLSLESVQVRQVMNLKTAAEMWTRLESLYELKNPTSKHLLLQRFFEYKMNKDTSVGQHVAKVEEMARQLEDLGHKQEEVTLVTKVLHSLPESFRNLISAWDSVPEKEQTMKNLLPRLMKEELLNKGMAALHLDDVDTGSALYSNGKRPKIIKLIITFVKLMTKLEIRTARKSLMAGVITVESTVTNVRNADSRRRIETTAKQTLRSRRRNQTHLQPNA